MHTVVPSTAYSRSYSKTRRAERVLHSVEGVCAELHRLLTLRDACLCITTEAAEAETPWCSASVHTVVPSSAYFGSYLTKRQAEHVANGVEDACANLTSF